MRTRNVVGHKRCTCAPFSECVLAAVTRDEILYTLASLGALSYLWFSFAPYNDTLLFTPHLTIACLWPRRFNFLPE